MPNSLTPTERRQHERGLYLARLLGIKRKANGRYDTAWGDKTAVGLFLTLRRVINAEPVELSDKGLQNLQNHSQEQQSPKEAVQTA